MSAQSLQAVADKILNDTYGGLKAPLNISLSLQQVEDDFISLRNASIPEALSMGAVSRIELLQGICLDLLCTDASLCCDNKAELPVMRSKDKLPRLLQLPGSSPVGYVGPVDQSLPKGSGKLRPQSRPFRYVDWHRVAYMHAERYHPPTVAQDPEGYLYLFYSEVAQIYLTAVFEDPKALVAYGCSCKVGDMVHAEVKMPAKLISDLSAKLTERYVRYYKQWSFPQASSNSDQSHLSSK